VTSIKDSGSGSLRAEIAAAHSGDTLVFSPKLDGKTITLTSGELDITQNLMIQGPGSGELTISGNSANWYSDYGALRNTYASRVFEVAQNTTVTLSGLTINNGDGIASPYGQNLLDFCGGGIMNHGTLAVSGCTISNNHADHVGGGIYSDGTLTVTGCTVSGNHAIGGAGIDNAGTATLLSSTISSNIADWVDGAYQPHGVGGGIFNAGTLTLSSSTISGNLANYEGSGIYNDTSGTVTVENSSSIAQDAYNLGVLYVDSTSTIGVLDGNPAILI
jgi:predicted outer membrane repeat protein